MLRIEQLEDFLDRPSLCLVAGPAGHRFGNRIERGDPQPWIGGDHGIADRTQGHLSQFAFAVQRGLERLALSDVLRLRNKIEWRSLGIAHGRHTELDVHDVAVLVEIALFQLVRLAFPGRQLCQQLQVGGKVVGMCDVGDVQLQQFIFAIAKHLAYRSVDAHEVAIRMGQCHADRGMLERTEEALFAFVQLQLQRAPFGDVDHRGEDAAGLAVGVEIRLKIPVDVAPFTTVEQLAFITAHAPGQRFFQRRAGTLIVALADHIDDASANQSFRIQAEPGAVGFVGETKAQLMVEIRKQHRSSAQDPPGPIRLVMKRRQYLGRLVRPHGLPSTGAPPVGADPSCAKCSPLHRCRRPYGGDFSAGRSPAH